MLSSKLNSTRPDRLARWAGICALLAACAVQADAEIGGWREAVLSVSNLDTWEQTLTESGGWETLLRAEGDPDWLLLWDLPAGARFSERLLRNPGTETGHIRLVRFDNVPQVQIRSNGQTWETGGIFDLNVRVLDIDARFAELQARDWQGFGDPVRFTFGPFVVREWLGRGPDGIVFALIEREAPPLDGWPELRRFSRSFNSTQIVADMDASLRFYKHVLGFQTYVETEGPGDTAGPNVLGLPHDLVTKISRRTVIVHPNGENEGSVELIEFDGIGGRDFADRARPPNLGVLSLRFPVRELDVLASTLTEAGFAPTTRGSARLPPYGVVEVLVVRGPNGEWLEFYEDTSGCLPTRC
jgi:catechol 2,3-dioxygenase-like lactoylglutathione lyase family enzyme